MVEQLAGIDADAVVGFGALEQPLDALAVARASQPSAADVRAASMMPTATASPCSQRS